MLDDMAMKLDEDEANETVELDIRLSRLPVGVMLCAGAFFTLVLLTSTHEIMCLTIKL
jgi:hypothetical protein